MKHCSSAEGGARQRHGKATVNARPQRHTNRKKHRQPASGSRGVRERERVGEKTDPAVIWKRQTLLMLNKYGLQAIENGRHGVAERFQ